MTTRLENAINLYLEGIRDGNAREAVTKYTVRDIHSIAPESRMAWMALSNSLSHLSLEIRNEISRYCERLKTANMCFCMSSNL